MRTPQGVAALVPVRPRVARAPGIGPVADMQGAPGSEGGSVADCASLERMEAEEGLEGVTCATNPGHPLD